MLEWLEITSRADIAFARQKARTVGRDAGLSDARLEELIITASELTSNMQRYAGGGLFLAQVMDLPQGPTVALIARDEGPGIADLDKMRRDRVSSQQSAGIGIGAIERLSDNAEVLTGPQGTLWACSFNAPDHDPRPDTDIAALRIAYPGEDDCGDAWAAVRFRGGLRLALADGMGHGAAAAEAGQAMAEAAISLPILPPKERLQSLGAELRGTRGGVISILDLHRAGARVDYGNLGNISALRLRHGEQQRLTMRDGFVGSPSARPMQESFELERGDLFILHSDGLRNLPPDLVLRLSGRGSLLIAAALLTEPGLTRKDDLSVAVVRWTPDLLAQDVPEEG